MAGAAPGAAPSRAERAGRIAKVLWIILGLNWSVALFKLAVGHFAQSITIFADGLHSFSDGTSNIIGLVAISIARHPADFDHPYGHQKYETLASTAIAFLLFFLSFRIYKEAVVGFLHPVSPQIGVLAFGVMIATLLVNAYVVRYERAEARRLSSDLLTSDSWHTLTDIFVTASVLVAMIGIRLGVPRLDSLFAFVIATVIFATAAGILKKSSDILCDKAMLDPAVIESIVRRVEGVRDCHEIRTRGKPDEIYVDLHVLVDSDMTVERSHGLAHRIEHEIRSQRPSVQDVVVHIEPVSHGHEEA